MEVKEFAAYPKCVQAHKTVVKDECDTDEINKKLDDKICKDELKDLKDADDRKEGKYAARELKQCYEKQKSKFQDLKYKCIAANTTCLAECDSAKIPSQDGGREICESSVNKAKAALAEKAAACQAAKTALAQKIDTAVAKIDDTLNNDIFRNQQASRHCDRKHGDDDDHHHGGDCNQDNGDSGNQKATASAYGGLSGGILGFGAGILSQGFGNMIPLPGGGKLPTSGSPNYSNPNSNNQGSSNSNGSSNSGNGTSTATASPPAQPAQPVAPPIVRTEENSMPNPQYYRFTAPVNPATPPSAAPPIGGSDVSGNEGSSPAVAAGFSGSGSSSSNSSDFTNSKVPGFAMKGPAGGSSSTTVSAQATGGKLSANVYQGFEYAAAMGMQTQGTSGEAVAASAPRNFEGGSPIQERNVRSAGRIPASLTDASTAPAEVAEVEEPALSLRLRGAIMNWILSKPQDAQKAGTLAAAKEIKTEAKPISTVIVEAVVEKVPSLKGFLSQVLKSTGPARMTGMEATAPTELLGANENLFHHVNGRYQRLQSTLIEEQN